MESANSSEKYRLGVGIILLNPLGMVFVGQRLDSVVEAWQMPQGGIEPEELPEAAAERELEEETGVSETQTIATSSGWYTYQLPNDLRGKALGGDYIGQKQKWFVKGFSKPDHFVNINTANPEFKSWKWVDFLEIADFIVPFKRKLYQDLVLEFGPVVEKVKGGFIRF